MTRNRCALALFLGAIYTADASAQFFPPPVILVQQPGISFQYNRPGLRVSGFFPAGPYGTIGYPYVIPGAIETRIVVQINAPTVAVQPRRRSLMPYLDDYDIAGVDLDVEHPSKIWGNKPALAKNAPAKKIEAVKVAPPEPKKQPEKLAKPEPPKADPRPPGVRLLDDGIAAFNAGEYGVALLRFRQTDANRGVFLQAQASIAIGKYRDAVQLIQEGLRRQPQWPNNAFRPKIELYGNQEAVWKEHRKQLEQAQRDQPNDADYLFLLGYLTWFDDQRDVAVVYFRQSRVLAADPQWADLFLKAAKI